MRKITKKVVEAFLAGKSCKVGSTSTTGHSLFLHGNLIAWKIADGTIAANMAGWGSVTTRERLNGLCELMGLGRPFHQKQHVQYYRDVPIVANETIVLK